MTMTIPVKNARDFALKAHGDQKYSNGVPYIKHLDEVVEILNKYGYGDYVEIVGYLHDVVEDTDVTTGKIFNQFGSFVGVCVAFLTDNEFLPNRKEKKKAFYKKIKNLDENHTIVLIVKAADRLANVRNGEKLQMYKKEHKKFKKAVYRPGLCDEIWEEIDKIMEPKLKKFYMLADFEFEAVDIEDAFNKLRKHFNILSEDGESDLIQKGNLEIAPVEAKEDNMPEAYEDFYKEYIIE